MVSNIIWYNVNIYRKGEFMKSYIKWLDQSSKLVKVLLALPFLDGIFWGLYRLFKGIVKNDGFAIIMGIIWIFVGAAILWIIDIITLVFTGKVILD